MKRLHTILLATTLGVASAAISGCGVQECRFDPQCGGGIGSFCDSHGDCDTDFCCMESSNCAGGMCSYECDSSADCPDDMRCEHHVCFFACATNDECADGMSCEHGATVCEWP
jgi:hypothetical protein